LDLSLLATLRYKIATATKFADVFNYFFDHFGENPEFFEVGELTEDPVLIKLISIVSGELFKTKRIVLTNMRLIEIKSEDFIHGPLIINGSMATVIYCTALQKGILCVKRPNSGGNTDFVRFSAEMLPPNFSAETSSFKH
jgi:hypothetical protein